MAILKPRLFILKREDVRDYSLRSYIRFAVVDLDRSRKYPENFVCIWPQQISSIVGQSSVFNKVFGANSLELAKRLLTEALKTEDDSDIKSEIKRRLQTLEPKPVLQKRCPLCGNTFQQKRIGRFRPRICDECRKKKVPTRE